MPALFRFGGIAKAPPFGRDKAMNRLLAIILPFVLASCGYEYFLRGHGTDNRTAPLMLKDGQRKLAVTQKLIPVRFGYDLGMISEDPSIVEVRYRHFPEKPIWLLAQKPGVTTVYYGNLLSRPHLKGLPVARRAALLRDWGDGFPVTVTK